MCSFYIAMAFKRKLLHTDKDIENELAFRLLQSKRLNGGSRIKKDNKQKSGNEPRTLAEMYLFLVFILCEVAQ